MERSKDLMSPNSEFEAECMIYYYLYNISVYEKKSI